MIRNIFWLTKLRTYVRLGLINVISVIFYRLTLRIRLHPAQYILAPSVLGPFFHESKRNKKIPPEISDWNNSIHFFSWYSQKNNYKKVPNWFADPFLNKSQNKNNLFTNWWNISDFGNGDIKVIWELSRFNWVIAFATKLANGDKASLTKLNFWLQNWTQENPPYKGPNWKCGQECSIRVINLIVAAWILGQDLNSENGLVELIKVHLQRIDKTLHYARAQDNNHATSEAAALFIGGSFLIGQDRRAAHWIKKGRKLLENYASNLIEPDGTFSQYSLNYHRVMLDTYSLVEAWRRHKNLHLFSDNLFKKLSKATEWIWTFIDSRNGHVPNIGHNDGAQILQLSRSDYRDYRPSVQLAASLFMNIDAFGDGKWNESLLWLGIQKGKFNKKKIVSKNFIDGGFCVLRKNKQMAILNYPKFSFRPSHAHALHVDFWSNGMNLLRDGGTFSYNSNLTEWYQSTAAHNTIEFDKRDQMPRISRFLFGDWIKTKEFKFEKNNDKFLSASATYTDSYGNTHKRLIKLTGNKLVCYDKIDGKFSEACLRWRLIPGKWKLKDKIITNQNYSILIKVNGKLKTPKLGETFESLYYYQQNKVPMIYVKVNKPSSLITTFIF